MTNLNYVGIVGTLLFYGDVHAFLFVGRIVLGKDTQQGSELQPPLVFGDALPIKELN